MRIFKLRYLTAAVLCAMLAAAAPMPEKTFGIVQIDGRSYISLHDFTASMDIQNSFDIVTGRGKILRKGSVAVYQTGMSAMLINNCIIRADYPVMRQKGELLMPSELFTAVMTAFYPQYVSNRHKNALNFSVPGKPQKEQEPQNNMFDISRTAADKITFIIIDPGHGGKDPGAIGKGRVLEKNITLKVSKMLEEYLKARMKGIKIMLTRRSDKYLELSERTAFANRQLKKNENGLFISVHVNASIAHTITGFETYFLSQNPSNEDARTTAALENNVIILEENSRKKAYSDVEHVEAIMLNTQIQKESSMLAGTIQKSMDNAINESKSKGVKNADFFVLRGSLMPAVLVEVGFISNKREMANLQSRAYQRKLASGIGDGVLGFIKDYNKSIKK